MRQEVSSRLQVENELRVALERNQLEVYFQPIVIAAAGNTVAAEALCAGIIQKGAAAASGVHTHSGGNRAYRPNWGMGA